jgi:hypothetical protein
VNTAKAHSDSFAVRLAAAPGLVRAGLGSWDGARGRSCRWQRDEPRMTRNGEVRDPGTPRISRVR